MHYMLPRIDSHVSIQLNHLLKLPFCIHPDSGIQWNYNYLYSFLGKICVPLNSENVENFDPMAVPDLMELVFNSRQPNADKIPGMDIFEKTCLNF